MPEEDVTPEDQTIQGSGRNDYLVGGEGDDLILGEGGRDFIVGGKGDDTIYGGESRDYLYGGEGDDDVRGGGGVMTKFTATGVTIGSMATQAQTRSCLPPKMGTTRLGISPAGKTSSISRRYRAFPVSEISPSPKTA